MIAYLKALWRAIAARLSLPVDPVPFDIENDITPAETPNSKKEHLP